MPKETQPTPQPEQKPAGQSEQQRPVAQGWHIVTDSMPPTLRGKVPKPSK